MAEERGDSISVTASTLKAVAEPAVSRLRSDARKAVKVTDRCLRKDRFACARAALPAQGPLFGAVDPASSRLQRPATRWTVSRADYKVAEDGVSRFWKPSIEHSWEFEDALAPYQHPEDRSFLHSGRADNHNLPLINYLPATEAFPPGLRDTNSQHWFTREAYDQLLDITYEAYDQLLDNTHLAYNQLLDNTLPTQSRSSTPDQKIQHLSPEEDFFRDDTLSSFISTDKSDSHELPESDSSNHKVTEAADHEALSTATHDINRKIKIPPHPVAMKRTSRPNMRTKVMKTNDKSSEQLQDNLESELKEFGWISLLGALPNFQAEVPPNKLNLINDMVQLWDRPQEAQLPSSTIWSELIASNQISTGDAIRRSVLLCEEIRLRLGNLLAIFTAPPNLHEVLTLSKSNLEEGLIFQEQNSLLNWLMDQVHKTPTEEDSVYLLFRSTIINYLKIDPQSENSRKVRWKSVINRRDMLHKFATLHQAITTQAAIKILEAYLKSTNLSKWNVLITQERRLFNLFKYLRCLHHHYNISKLQYQIPVWASSGFFPWKGPLDPDHQNKLKKLFERVDKYNKYGKQESFVDINKEDRSIAPSLPGRLYTQTFQPGLPQEPLIKTV
ncbi:hypothetical protein VP01_3018g1 [Puccinia sorghi]|uniref:Uncharacterized protein n=1 Tax=Puccinia sorghi TaxID=27349 RepID=A0A0L6V1Z3_9BASI|nr:hypothetical protein VP01_3018g1 [Puccinia sorghi]